MANNNTVNLSLSSPTATGTTNINATGSGVTTIGNSSGGALTIASNGNSTWAMNNVSFTLTTGTGNINIGADNTIKTMNIGSSSTTQFIINSSGMTIDSGASSGSAASITKLGTGDLTFTQTGTGTAGFSGTGTLNFCDSTVPTSIQFGNRATAVNGTIGGTTTTTSVTFHTGSGNINIGNNAAQTIQIDCGSPSGGGTLILNTGTGGINLPSIEVTTTSATLITGIAYTANNASLVTLTLPSLSIGNVFKVCGFGAGGWKIAQLASQTIHSSTTNTTTGTGGSLSSGGRYDSVELVAMSTTVLTVKENKGTLTFV